MSRVTIDLDPAHPTLDHHRPGPDPLFGTAMGIAAMIDAAAAGGGAPTGIRAVQVYAPYILGSPGPHSLVVALDARSPPSGEAAGRIVSSTATHFAGVIEWQTAALATPAALPEHAGASVDGAAVYATFFHGPAFQVVASARLHAAGLTASASTAPAVAALPSLVRLIEFGLQSAGLLELARSGRMMVPHRVAHIALLGPLPDSDTPLVAAAHRRRDGENALTDIVIGANRPIVAIEGYATVELPFAADGQGLADLRRALIATETGH